MELFVGSLVEFYASQGQQDAGSAVAHWHQDLQQALAPHLQEPLPVPEDTGAPLRRPLDARALRAVQLLSIYAQHPEYDWPDELPEDLEVVPEWKQTAAGDFGRSRFPQVQIPRLWYPGDFAFTARQPMPDGAETQLGSREGLALQLRLLNEQTIGLEAMTVAVQAAAPPEEGAGFLPWAEHGLALMLMGAGRAQQLRTALMILPLV